MQRPLEAVALAESTNAQTVLVVDDEATIRHLIDEVLDELGYTVIGAADGAAGIKVLQSGAKIELLITDVGLPGGMSGRQVADAARVLRPGLKVLFITGFAENAAIGNGHLEPGMELLTKPFTLERSRQRSPTCCGMVAIDADLAALTHRSLRQVGLFGNMARRRHMTSSASPTAQASSAAAFTVSDSRFIYSSPP